VLIHIRFEGRKLGLKLCNGGQEASTATIITLSAIVYLTLAIVTLALATVLLVLIVTRAVLIVARAVLISWCVAITRFQF